MVWQPTGYDKRAGFTLRYYLNAIKSLYVILASVLGVVKHKK